MTYLLLRHCYHIHHHLLAIFQLPREVIMQVQTFVKMELDLSLVTE